jgi:hypothetical protein
LSEQTEVMMGILGPGSFIIPGELTCRLCKKASSLDGSLRVKLGAGQKTDFAIESHCVKCGHISFDPCMK